MTNKSVDGHEECFMKEDAYELLELTNNWIGHMDSKASFLLAYLAVLIGFIVSDGVPRIFTELTDSPTAIILWVEILLVILLYLTWLLSLGFLLGTLTARVKTKKIEPSLLYFGDISKLSSDKYKMAILNRTNEDLINDILDQIHINSTICSQKSKLYNMGLVTTLSATGIYIVCMWLNIL